MQPHSGRHAAEGGHVGEIGGSSGAPLEGPGDPRRPLGDRWVQGSRPGTACEAAASGLKQRNSTIFRVQ